MEAGRVGRPHGLDGSFLVTRPWPSVLVKGQRVRVAGAARTIERRAGTDERPIVRLSHVASREAAEALRGEPLWVTRDAAPALGEDEYWIHDLLGCEVVDGEQRIGVVRDVLTLPSCEALAVDRGGGEPLLVPVVRDAVRSVDLAAGRIDVDMAFLG